MAPTSTSSDPSSSSASGRNSDTAGQPRQAGPVQSGTEWVCRRDRACGKASALPGRGLHSYCALSTASSGQHFRTETEDADVPIVVRDEEVIIVVEVVVVVDVVVVGVKVVVVVVEVEEEDVFVL